jgi:divalent metal cation (Fe/Co/Zn/Cd) transporter
MREHLLRRGLVLTAVTIVWNVLEGVVAVVAGAISGSVALIGFGVDSFIETASAAVVGVRLYGELRTGSGERAERMETVSARIAGGLLLLLALYVAVDALRRLLGRGPEPEPSVLGIVLTAVSLVVMPFLAWGKLRTARALGSRALRADAHETLACAWLSFTTLAGLSLNAVLGWSWADPVAALVLVPLIAREGLEGIRGEECEHDEDEP